MYWLFDILIILKDFIQIIRLKASILYRSKMIRFFVKFPGQEPYFYGVLSTETGLIFCENRLESYHLIFQYFTEFQKFCEKIDPNYRIIWIDARQ